MIRESLAANASHAFSSFVPNQAFFYDRASTGANAASQARGFANPAAPYWVKLVRNGSTFFAFFSVDGLTWSQIGTGVTITMGQSADFGLVSSSGSATTLGIATFDNVVITPGATPNITSVSPSTAAVATSVTITGSSFGASQGMSQLKL